MVDQRALERASSLLDKARATSFPAEREALALRAYSQLASYLNSVPDEGPSARRRERRLLRDRRKSASAEGYAASRQATVAAGSAAAYRLEDGRRPAVGRRLDIAL